MPITYMVSNSGAYMNRLVEGLGIELDPAYVGVPAQRLAERGYRPLIDMLGHAAPGSSQRV